MMLHDGVVDLHAASWLASANYLGYLSGALLCTFVPLLWSRLPGSKPIDGPALVRAGLAGTARAHAGDGAAVAGGVADAALPRRRRQRDGVRVRLRLVPDAARAARPRRARRRDVRRAGRRHRRAAACWRARWSPGSHVGDWRGSSSACSPALLTRVGLARLPDARGRARCRAPAVARAKRRLGDAAPAAASAVAGRATGPRTRTPKSPRSPSPTASPASATSSPRPSCR